MRAAPLLLLTPHSVSGAGGDRGRDFWTELQKDLQRVAEQSAEQLDMALREAQRQAKEPTRRVREQPRHQEAWRPDWKRWTDELLKPPGRPSRWQTPRREPANDTGRYLDRIAKSARNATNAFGEYLTKFQRGAPGRSPMQRPKPHEPTRAKQTADALRVWLNNVARIPRGRRAMPETSQEEMRILVDGVKRQFEQLSMPRRGVAPWPAPSKTEDRPPPTSELLTAIEESFRRSGPGREVHAYALQLTQRVQERGVFGMRPRDYVPQQVSEACNEQLRRAYLENQLPLWEKVYGREEARRILQRSPYYQDPMGLAVDAAVTRDVWQVWYIYDPSRDRWVSARHLPLMLAEDQIQIWVQVPMGGRRVELEFDGRGAPVRLTEDPGRFIAESVRNPDFAKRVSLREQRVTQIPIEVRQAFERELGVRQRWHEFGAGHPIASFSPTEGPRHLKDIAEAYVQEQVLRDLQELVSDGAAFVGEVVGLTGVSAATAEMARDAASFVSGIKRVFEKP